MGIHIRLELEQRTRDLVVFYLRLDSKLRGCDLVKLKVSDVVCGRSALKRTMVVQQKTGSPLQFKITPNTGESILAWVKEAGLKETDYLFKSRINGSERISTRQYNRIFNGWIKKLSSDSSLYSTHSMRRTKPYLIYKKTKNLRVVQLLLGHQKLETTFRYLGIKVDDALEISESIEV